jgi:mono/diheme cytochrome c family protein
MRERFARGVIALTVMVALGLSVLFAARHNRTPEKGGPVSPVVISPAPLEPLTTPPVVETLNIQLGLKVYTEQRCSSCHSIKGEGNPRSPLDGVGSHLTPEDIKMWILGSGGAAETLSPAVQRRKQRYQSIPAEEMNALVAYLATLKEPAR